MALNSTTAASLLKNRYIGPIREQLNNDTVLLKYPGKDRESVTGGNVVMPIHLSRNISAAGAAEGGTFLTAGNQGYQATSFKTKYHYLSISVTDVIMRRTYNDEGAFARALASEVKQGATDMAKYLNVLLYGNGTGKIATATLTSNSTTVNVVTNRNLVAAMQIDVVTESTAAVVANDRTVSSLSSTNKFVISGAAITAGASTEVVVKQDSFNACLMGLDGICSASDPPSGDFQGIDRATYSEWQGNVLSNSGTARTLTLALLEQAINTAQRWRGDPNIILSNYGPRKEYVGLCTTNKRFVNTMDLDAGVGRKFRALEFDGIPWVVDTDAPYNSTTNGKAYFLDLGELIHFRAPGGEFEWLEDDKGAMLLRAPTDGIWKASLVYDGEFGTGKPRAHCLLDDILLTVAEIE